MKTRYNKVDKNEVKKGLTKRKRGMMTYRGETFILNTKSDLVGGGKASYYECQHRKSCKCKVKMKIVATKEGNEEYYVTAIAHDHQKKRVRRPGKTTTISIHSNKQPRFVAPTSINLPKKTVPTKIPATQPQRYVSHPYSYTVPPPPPPPSVPVTSQVSIAAGLPLPYIHNKKVLTNEQYQEIGKSVWNVFCLLNRNNTQQSPNPNSFITGVTRRRNHPRFTAAIAKPSDIKIEPPLKKRAVFSGKSVIRNGVLLVVPSKGRIKGNEAVRIFLKETGLERKREGKKVKFGEMESKVLKEVSGKEELGKVLEVQKKDDNEKYELCKDCTSMLVVFTPPSSQSAVVDVSVFSLSGKPVDRMANGFTYY